MTRIYKQLLENSGKFSLAAVMLAVLFAALLGYNLLVKTHQQFVYLADSFSKGKLYFQEEHQPSLAIKTKDGKIIWTDTAPCFRDKRCWPLGPFPAVLLLPLVIIFGTGLLQGYASFPLTLLNFYLLFRLAKKFELRSGDALWLAAFFVFGSVYLGVAVFPVSWYFAQVVAVTALLLSLFEYFEKRRPWLIGIYLALALATRSNLILAALFFVLSAFWEKDDWRRKVKNLIQLALPILAAALLLIFYNYARFGNVLESGYNFQDIPPPFSAARSEGLFSWRHLPANLFFLLLRGPNPVLARPDAFVLKYPYITADVWGMSIFLTSPVLIYLFAARWRDRLVKAAALTSLLILLPIITYYGIGTVQLGYRYALDFYPFLYLILCQALAPKVPTRAKILVALGVLLNWHFLLHFQS